MAAVRLIALHANKGKTVAQCLGDRTDYAKNPEKTEKGNLVTAYECDPMTVDEEFMLSKRKYQQITGREQQSDVIAYQIRQSFKPGEITAEEANRLGYELAMRFTKGKYAFIVATHTDRAHIHNHVIFNSTALDGTRKFQDFHLSGLALQRLSDVLCLENGLSIIAPKPYGERQKRTVFPRRPKLRDLMISRKEVYNLLASPQNAGVFEYEVIADRKRITKESFARWYAGQDKYCTFEDLPPEEQARIEKIKQEAAMPRLKVADDKPSYDLQEVAILLNMSYRDVSALIRDGYLEAKQFGKKKYVLRDELQWFLLQQKLNRES